MARSLKPSPRLPFESRSIHFFPRSGFIPPCQCYLQNLFPVTRYVLNMYSSSTTFLAAALLGASAVVLASPAPKPTPAPSPAEVARGLEKRAACTFSGSDGYSLASASKASCATIVLSALSVPSGVTLDLTGLADGTAVSGPRTFFVFFPHSLLFFLFFLVVVCFMTLHCL